MQEQELQNKTLKKLQEEAIQLLIKLIETPSFSKTEEATAQIILNHLQLNGVIAKKHLNNIWATNKHFDETKPTLLLNSHHDTVKPNSNYTLNPFKVIMKDGKLFGLGSNDAGGSLVALISVFLHFYNIKNLKYNIIFVASAEEEISGTNGIEAVLPNLGAIAFGIVGEPTQMQMAIAEKGLLVIDCIDNGIAGHAARDEGDNAITHSVKNIQWFNNFKFDKVSELLGPVKMTVTSITTDNKAHNVIPTHCKFTVDIRVNELYTLEEIIATIKKNTSCEVNPRSLRMKPTSIHLTHPIILSGLKLNRNYYGSPTTSDKALMPFPTLKMGPGDSARSHTADEFIYIKEIKEGIELYINLLENIL